MLLIQTKEIDHILILVSREAWFLLSGYVNSLNNICCCCCCCCWPNNVCFLVPPNVYVFS